MSKASAFSFVAAIGLLAYAVAGVGTEPGYEAGSFVRDGIGARAFGMGGAFVALADDSSTTVWNPAGLAQLEGLNVGGMYTDRFGQGIEFQSVEATARISAFGVGLTMVRSAIDVPITGPGGAVTGSLAWTDALWLGSVGCDLGAAFLDLSDGSLSGLRVGGNVKYYVSTALEGKGSGFGLDLSVLAKLDLGDVTVSLGLTSLDVGQTKVVWTGTTGNPENYVPWIQKVGVALGLFEERVRLAVDGDLALGSEELNRLHAGIEVAPIPQFALRGGATLGSDGLWQFSAGGTLEWRGMSIDFAYVPHEVLGASYIVSLAVSVPAPWESEEAVE